MNEFLASFVSPYVKEKTRRSPSFRLDSHDPELTLEVNLAGRACHPFGAGFGKEGEEDDDNVELDRRPPDVPTRYLEEEECDAAIPHRRQPMKENIPRFTITTVAGTGALGFDGDGGPAVEALTKNPTAVALDRHGNLYIADVYNLRIRRVDTDGTISTIMGTDSSDAQADDRPAIETNLDSAYGIAMDTEDNLYVLSRGHSKILRLGSDGIARRIVGTGESGFGGDGGPAIEARIQNPCHLVVDSKGTLFIADTGNHRIRKVTTDGVITTIAGTGEEGYSGDGGPAIEARLAAPAAIAIDREGNLYIADFINHRIRRLSRDGIISSIAGTGEPEYNGDGRPALECQIGEPCGVAVDQDGYVCIGDQVNNRVRVVTPSGVMHTVAGTGVEGYAGDGGPAESAQISNPDIIAFDREGNLYVPDYSNAVVRKLTRVAVE